MASLLEALDRARDGGVWRGRRVAPWALVRRRARRVAGGLREAGVRPGEAVGIAVGAPRSLALAVLAVAACGAVPVVLPPGRDAVRAALTAAGARRLLVDGALRGPGVVALAGLDGPELEREAPGDVAVVRFTGGATGPPRPVALTAANLAANAAATADRLGLRRGAEVWVGWAGDPLGALLPALWLDAEVALPGARGWLGAIAAARATVSFAPEAAYRAAGPRDGRQDLSAWRVAGCVGEVVHPDTLAAFAERHRPSGLRAGALVPAFGLAELGGLAAAAPPGRPVVVERGVVGVGPPLAGHRARVVDPAGRPVPDGVVGEIVLDGPSVTPGRLGEPPTGGVVPTGDAGFVDDGELFVCGRLRERLQVRGRSHCPDDLERLAEAVPGVVRGSVVAMPDPGRDGAVVLVETRDPRVPPAIAAQIAAAVRVEVHVEGVAPRSLPRTPLGRIRRPDALARYVSGLR